MLPTEPKSDLIVSQTDEPILNSTRNSMYEFAGKTGSLILKYPFWVLVISSVGIHTAFAFITPNLLKKTEPPREVLVSTLPVVKLPPRLLPTKPKSLFDNLFVKPPTSKIGSPLYAVPNKFPSILSTTPQSSFDLSTFDSLEDLPPLNDFSFSVPPLSNSPRQVDPSQFVKPPTPVSISPPPSDSRFTPSGKIDNTAPLQTADNSSSNIKPEFQNDGLKQDMTSTSAITKDTNTGKDPDKTAKNLQGTVSANADRNKEDLVILASGYPNDEQFMDLLSKKSVVNTLIVPADKLISADGPQREKGVAWIPPKVANVSGKSGSVTFMWLVDPNGEVKTLYWTSSKFKELDDIARETVKDYKFKPIEDLSSGKYRLVTAKYDFR